MTVAAARYCRFRKTLVVQTKNSLVPVPKLCWPGWEPPGATRQSTSTYPNPTLADTRAKVHLAAKEHCRGRPSDPPYSRRSMTLRGDQKSQVADHMNGFIQLIHRRQEGTPCGRRPHCNYFGRGR
jgi:hypothetical protein